ncbi:putative SAWADEE domain-containing protein [Helianthus anomalus]
MLSSTRFRSLFKACVFVRFTKIKHFLHRFCPVSKPVEDYECSRLVQGMFVCANYRKDEAMYFDAVVDVVCIYL